jgi:hypothetical protein
MLFVTGERQQANQIDQYRRRLKARNGLIELGACNDKLQMSEDGKYRFRLTQQLIDKLLMVLNLQASLSTTWSSVLGGDSGLSHDTITEAEPNFSRRHRGRKQKAEVRTRRFRHIIPSRRFKYSTQC